eukprot:COSAG02_NODE_10942_length_1827_cov_3.390625_1_plen_117_part_00
MAAQTIPAKIMRQAGFGLNNSAGAFGHDGVRSTRLHFIQLATACFISIADSRPVCLFVYQLYPQVGGKFVWADPETGLSFALVTNTFTQRGACLIRSMELSTLANDTLMDQKPASL